MTTHDLQNLIDLAWEASPEPHAATPRSARAVEAGHRRSQCRAAARGRAPGRGPMDRQPVGQEGGAAELPPRDNQVMRSAASGYFDKVQTKFAHVSEDAMRATGIRVVPPAVARRGSFIGRAWC